MKCEVEIEGTKPQALPFRLGFQALDLGTGPGDGHRFRSIQGGDLRWTSKPVEKVAGGVRSERQRRHAAPSLRALLVPAARYHNSPGVAERQRIRGPSRGNLADTVTEVS